MGVFQSRSHKERSFRCHSCSESWVDEVIRRNKIRAGADCSGKVLDLGDLAIDAAHATWYLDLQLRISKLIPHEASRPCFKIAFVHRGGDAALTSKRLLLLGGMGPISDGELIACVFSNYEHVYLASNTAHVHLPLLRRLKGGDRIVDLATHVAAAAAVAGSAIASPLPSSSSSQENSEKRPVVVLVLGTTQARKKSLYEGRLRAAGLGVVETALGHEQDAVQADIDGTKMNILADGGARLFNLVCEKGGGGKADVVLLGCTELPIALRGRMKDLEGLGFVVVDSEKVFARVMSDDIKGLYAEKKAAKATLYDDENNIL